MEYREWSIDHNKCHGSATWYFVVPCYRENIAATWRDKRKGMVEMGYIDIHSHILPGMDDGSENMEETLEMLRIAQDEGITDIIATPHYKSGRFRADAGKLHAVLDEVRQRAGEQGIHINLYAGNEIYYHSELEERLESGRLSTMNGTEYVLVEFSPFEEYLYIRNAAYELLGMGYTPIIAHVERYACLTKKREYVKELKSMGCGIQVNAGSIVGDTGWRTAKFVKGLLKEELVDYLGTDAHDSTGRRRPAMAKCAAYLKHKCRQEYAEALLHGNAAENLLGERYET